MGNREIDTRAFALAMGQPVDMELTADNVRQLFLRAGFIREEFLEVMEALDTCHLDILQTGEALPESVMHLLKELADLQYVLSGFAAAFKLPLNRAFVRVHKSNLSKLGDDGKPVYRADGKVMKGPNYQPPYLADLVNLND